MIIGFLSDGCATHEMAFLMAVYLNIMLVIFIMTLHWRSTFSNPSVYYMAKSMWTGFVYFCLQLRGILMRQHAVIIPAFKTYLHVKPEKVNKGKSHTYSVWHCPYEMGFLFCFVLEFGAELVWPARSHYLSPTKHFWRELEYWPHPSQCPTSVPSFTNKGGRIIKSCFEYQY